MNALKEIQNKGDFMMEAIRDQKQVLIDLRSEVDIAEMKLFEAERETEEMEMKKKLAQKARLSAERDTRKIDNQKGKLEIEIKKLEEARVNTKKDLESLQEEVGRLRKQMEENGDKMQR